MGDAATTSEHHDRGNGLLMAGRWEEAIGAYELALASTPGYLPSLVNMGHGFCHLGRWEAAARAYGRARELDPNATGICSNLGDVLLRLGRFAEAIAPYEVAMREHPHAAAPRINLGHAFAHLDRWEESVGAYRQGLALEPGSPSWRANLADALSRLARWDEAAATYCRAFELDPTASELCERWAAALSGGKRWEEALAIYRRAIAERPGVVASHVNLGHALMHLCRWDEAVSAYRTAVALQPETASWRESVGDALRNTRRGDEAVAAYRAALRLDPELSGVRDKLADASQSVERLDDLAETHRHVIDQLVSKFHGLHSSLEMRQTVSRLYWKLGDAVAGLHRWEDATEAYRLSDEHRPRWSRAPGPVAAEHVTRWISDAARADGAGKLQAIRSMFVLDNDYGELTTVMLLLFGQEMAARSTLLLPPRLYVRNRDVLPGRTLPLRRFEDVLQAYDRERPDVVFLCSAYLLSLHGIVSLEELERFVAFLRDQGCRIVTTDPFLGLLSGLGGSTTISVDIPPGASAALERAKQEQNERLLFHFLRSRELMKHVAHVYPVPRGPWTEADPALRGALSFFNARLLCPYADPADPSTIGPRERVRQRPYWVFVIASRDYETQVMFQGKDAFVDLLIAKIDETLVDGRHPVLVVPHDLAQAIIGRMEPREAFTLLTFCPFEQFLTLLIGAEIAFYWNVVSHSMLLRLMNHRPLFMFDRGHLVRNVTPLYERAIDWYYQGHEPIFLHKDHVLRGGELLAAWHMREDGSIAAHQRLAKAAAPEALLAQVLRSCT